jgi:CIC family chloride channel protein
MHGLSASSLMRHDWISVPNGKSIAEFRERVPLGPAKKAIIADRDGHYGGIVTTDAAFQPDLDPATKVEEVAVFRTSLSPRRQMFTICLTSSTEKVPMNLWSSMPSVM